MRSVIAAAYLSRTSSRQPRRRRVGAILTACLLALTLVLALGGSARAASTFSIRGGGDGHGIGMSQYGAYGYALHGRGYSWILAHYYRGTALGKVARGRTVRVLVGWGTAAFSGADRIGGHRAKPGLTYSVRPNADGTLAVFKPSGKKLGTFAARLPASGPGPLSLAGVGTYRGALEFRPTGSGGIETVNVIGLEDYVRGVISAEMPSSWSAEALKVQAVAARTYALTSDAGGAVFDLYADTRSQMYRGVAAETASTDAAVAATRRQVVTYAGRPVVTYFFNSSGGHTENVENVWPGATPEPWLRGVVDRYDAVAHDPYHRWGDRLSVAAAAAKLGHWVRGRLIGIQILTHGSSPRILAAAVVGTKGRTRVTGIELQQAFGLLTTNASFTTLTTTAGRSAKDVLRSVSARHLPRWLAGSQAVVAIVPLINDLVAGATPGLHGSVFPPEAGVRIDVQRSVRGHWRTVEHVRTGRRGSFDAALRGRGSYRIVYRGLTGPVVGVR